MRRRTSITLASFGIIILTSVPIPATNAQPVQLLPGEILPIISGSSISAKILFAENSFRYDYRVANPVTSNADITNVGIDITAPQEGQDLSSAGLTLEGRTARHVQAVTSDYLSRGIRLIPVGSRNPWGWIASLDIQMGWFPRQPSGIKPGEKLSGFTILSYGLPATREAALEPTFQQAPVEEATEENESRLDAIDEAIRLNLKTIGPTAPPKVFDPVKYLAYIQDLKKQSVDLGWIRDQGSGVSGQLDEKLSPISGQLSGITDDKIVLSKGQKILELGAQFLQLVEEVSCKQFECETPKPLTSEAYALLFFNMEYFLDQVRIACDRATPFPSLIPPSPSPAPSRKPSPSPKKK